MQLKETSKGNIYFFGIFPDYTVSSNNITQQLIRRYVARSTLFLSYILPDLYKVAKQSSSINKSSIFPWSFAPAREEQLR